MKKNGNILIVDDNRGVLAALQLLLKPHFERIATLASPASLPAMLREDGWSVLLLDMNFTSGINNGNEGLYWLHEAKRLRPDLPVVLFTAYADIDLAVRGIKEGATDFVVKPWDNHRLVETLTTASRNMGNASAKDSDKPAMYWGESGAMQHLRTLVEKVARTDANVLITGENGTGKEMLARELHRLSLRGGHPLVTVDMGAVTETLFESELFGHVKGAFTDARADRAGKFEAADHGTLFLDEIGNLPYHLQAKLLTVLQRRSIVRVGSNTPIPVDIRLVCATNRDLSRMVKTCSTASTPSIWRFPRSANVRKTSSPWRNNSSGALQKNTSDRPPPWTKTPDGNSCNIHGKATYANWSTPSRRPSSSPMETACPPRPSNCPARWNRLRTCRHRLWRTWSDR